MSTPNRVVVKPSLSDQTINAPASIRSQSGGGTSDYERLSNKPSVNGVTLSGNKTAAQLSLDQVWWATINSTSLADIKTADAAGKIVMCKYTDSYGNEINLRLIDCTDDGYCYFAAFSKGLSEFFYAEVWQNGSATEWTVGSSHYPPTASQVGAVAVAQGVAHAGKFLVVGSDGNITMVSMTAWQGGNY
jgi:hypothetical protein